MRGEKEIRAKIIELDQRLRAVHRKTGVIVLYANIDALNWVLNEENVLGGWVDNEPEPS